MLKNIFKPFHQSNTQTTLLITIGWIVCVLGYWIISASQGDKHLFPTPTQVWTGFQGLWGEGLVVHIVASLGLFVQAAFYALIVSLSIAYLSPVPLIKPMATFMSKFRYLPLAGLSYYMTVLLSDARSMQVGVLVIFMTTYFITSLLAMVRDVPQEELDHARTLRCSRWETLWEVIVKGRIDMVLDILRQNFAIIWMMLVTVESILVASGGIGVLIKNSSKFANHGRIVALQIVILIVGISLDWTINQIRLTAFRYASK